MSYYDYLVCHYHKVDSLTWLSVLQWLQQCLVQRVAQGHDEPRIFLPAEMGDTLLLFIEQMETAYLHPRRDSYHCQRLGVKYSGFAARRKNVTANLSMKKNLSKTLKQSAV